MDNFTKFKCINGWTKTKMIEEIQSKMFDHCSQDNNGYCRYKAPDGNRCAVGVFVPDGHVVENEKDMRVKEALKLFPDLNEHMPLNHHGMNILQDRHDNSATDPRIVLINWINENVQD